MTAWNPKANDIFLEALEVGTPDDRRKFMDESCGDDPELRAQVESLIAAGDRAGSFLESPAVDFGPGGATTEAPEQRLREGPGALIGRYKLLQLIGEGGFGSVFMAQQDHPVRRIVALKVIKVGMDTKQVIARFEAERQALALMDHPNIAKVFDAGATDAGRPYFVMELVRGVPITDYCDANHLSTRERLELFVPVCHAVQHAHQKGVIHRDIKPSNIMVTLADGVPIPKVIDFGIAKATNARLTEATLFTEYRQLVGTPAYMSPEQAESTGIDVDTRTDVYSLGVLLYELLTGTTPFDPKELRGKAYGEIQRMIREVDPPRPSTRISNLGETLATTAARRRSEPLKLGPLMRRDLDWVVMKCLEKDRTHRYETANGLATDLRRYLSDEAVQARPTSAAYRASKFVRKHKAGAIGGAMVVLAVGLGLAVATAGFVRARVAQVVAERENAKAVKLSGFLRSMLASARPASPGAGRSVTLADLLDRTSEEVAGQFKDEPEVEIQVRYALAESYGSLRMWRQYHNALERAYHLVVQTGTLESELGLRIAARVARSGSNSVPEGAEGLARRTLERARRLYGDDHEVTFEVKGALANILSGRKPDEVEAEALLREWAAQARRMPPRTMLGFDPIIDFGRILRAHGNRPEAETVYRESLARGKGSYDQPWVAFELAMVLLEQGKSGAMPLLEQIIAEHRARDTDLHSNSSGEEAYFVSGALSEYHRQLVLKGKTEDLRRFHRDQIESVSRLAELPATTAETLRMRAHLRARVGRFPDALDDYNKAIKLDPAEQFQWYLRVCLLAYLADAGGYATHREAMLSRFGDVVDPPDWADRTVKSCVLLPLSGAELARCERLIDSAIAKGDRNGLPWFPLAKGMVEYRAGHFAECVEWSTKSRDTMPKSQPTVVAAAECFIAMGQYQLRNAADARAAFERARLIIETQVPNAGTDDIGVVGSLEDWLITQVAYREASALFAGG